MVPSFELIANNLSVSYDTCVALNIRELNLKGNTIGIIGHNGAGKSTLLKTILGLLIPEKGSIKINFSSDDKKIELLPEEHCAFCPETGAVFADIPVETYVRLWCRVKCNDANYYKKEGKNIIETFSITPLLKKLGRNLSKGEKRRVQTAIGFLTNPKVFLFDEPFDGLDVQRSHELTELLKERQNTTTFLISSHRMDIIERIADIIIVLKKGEVIACGSVETVTRLLAGSTVLISNISNLPEVTVALKEAFSASLISQIGSSLSVTGLDVTKDKVEKVTTLLKDSPFIEELRPSLVDAMNYHLRI